MLRRKRKPSDFNAEVEAHLELEKERLKEQGLSEEEARAAAHRAFGNVTRAEERFFESGRWLWWDELAQDVRFGLRQLRKNPGFTAIAIATLALGIGANTAIFSYIDAWMIKPLPYPESGRLMVFQSHDKKNGFTSDGLNSTASFLDFRRQTSSFDQTVMWRGWNFNLTGNGPPELVEGGRVSWNFFEALGARPILGRTFTHDEDEPGKGHVAVLGEGLWQSRFAGDPKVIGREILIGGEPYTVVGVLPGKFQYPLMGVANLWTPLALTDPERADRGSSGLAAFGRLKPGVTAEQAGAECAAIYGRLERQFPDTNTNLTLLVYSMKDDVARNEGAPAIMVCFLIVALILLIACANVANLMLARAMGRAKELAVRGAIGATRGRLLRQLLTESLILFSAGGIAGALFGFLGTRWIESQIPGHTRGYLVNYGHVDLDAGTLAFTMGIALLCGLVFGLAPAYEHSRHDVNRTLKESSGQVSGGKTSSRLRRIFVAAEITLAVVVLIATTLLVKSFVISVRSSPGFNPAHVVVAQLALPKTKYAEEWRWRRFGEDTLARLQALPHAAEAGVASYVPFGGFGGPWVEFEAATKPAPGPGKAPFAPVTDVSTNYFSAMQIQLLKGRFFNSADSEGHFPSAIISETMARRLWPNEDPVGQELRFGEQHTLATVVGVVNDIKMYNLRELPLPQMYVPLAQFPSATLSFVVRTAGDSAAMGPAVRDSIWAVDRDQPISSVEPLETLASAVNAGYRVLAKMLVVFGGLAMFLGAIGIYGLMSELVSRRTQEIGIRTALGASPRQVMEMVVGEGLKLALIGIAAGGVCALGVTRLLQNQLYEVAPYDPLTFIGVPLVFAAVAVAASTIPARRAMKVDPVMALRFE